MRNKMYESTIKVFVIFISVTILILINPVVKWLSRDKYHIYKDVHGKDVKIKIRGYIR